MRLLLIVIFTSFLTYAQSQNTYSLEQELNRSSDDSVRCILLKDLFRIEPDIAKRNSFNEQRKNIALSQLKKNTLTKNQKYFYKKQLAACYNNKGNVQDLSGNLDSAIFYFLKSLDIKEKLGLKKEAASSLNSIGNMYLKHGNIPKALFYVNKSLRMNEAINDSVGMAASLINLANIYYIQNDHSTARKHWKTILSFSDKAEFMSDKSRALNNIGVYYLEKDNYDSAYFFWNKYYDIVKGAGDDFSLATALNNLGLVCARNNDFSRAHEYYLQAIGLGEQSGNWDTYLSGLLNISTLYFLRKEPEKGFKNAMKALVVAKEIGDVKKLSEASLICYKAYKSNNQHKEALQYMEQYILMRDSLNNESTRKAGIRNQLKYEYEKQAAADSVVHAKETEVKNAQLAEQNAEIKAKKNQQYALFGGLALVMIFAGFMFNRFKVTQKQKGIIEEQKFHVEEQKKMVEVKQKEILDSIHYAKRIQMAQVPSEKRVEWMLRRIISEKEE